jgi:hypothetical protein
MLFFCESSRIFALYFEKRVITIIKLISLFSQAQLLPNFGGQRAGLSALSFLKE